jgi:hypothetical protein
VLQAIPHAITKSFADSLFLRHIAVEISRRMSFKSFFARSGWFALLALCALTFTGCSSFSRDWRAAGKASNPTDSIEGRWEGNWLSDANGHNGRLRCLMTKTSDGKYEARFHAKYMKIMGFKSTAMFDVKQEGTNYTFTGDADLGIFGLYHYDGKATPAKFETDYRCSYDHGTFKMSRP